MFTLFKQWRTQRQNSTVQQVAQDRINQRDTNESRSLNVVAPLPITMSDVASHSLQHGRGGAECGSLVGCGSGVGAAAYMTFCQPVAIAEMPTPLYLGLLCGSPVACGLFSCLLCSVSTFICGNPTEEHECVSICHGGFYASTLSSIRSCCGNN